MPDNEVEQLKKMITQLSLEFQEDFKKLRDKLDTMMTSLKTCQSRCHVQNQQEKP